jgi:ribose transport system substrate-binding protein
MPTRELCRSLGFSRETLRNELIALEREGFTKRDRGTVTLINKEKTFHALRATGTLPREQRRAEIVRLLRENATIRTRDLASSLGVSPATIRADLILLEQQRLVRCEHGYAVWLNNGEPISVPDSLFDESFSQSIRNIGDRSLSLIERSDLIFLDDSSFSRYIALGLPMGMGVNVVTNSLKVAIALARRGYDSDVFLLPGLLNKSEMSIDVQFEQTTKAKFFISKAFFGFTAYSAARGFFTQEHWQVRLFADVMAMSRSVYLQVESRRVGQSGKYALPVDPTNPCIAEVLTDDGLGVDAAAREFGERYPLVLCGKGHAIKGPVNRQHVIGFATLHGRYEISQLVRSGVEAAIKRCTNLELIVADNKMDRDATLANVKTFIEKKVDLVIEYQHDYGLSILIGEKLSHANIPVIAVDVPIPGAVYFGANNYRAGIIGGEAAASEVERRWNGGVDHLIVVTDRETGPIPESRITGMLDVLLRRITVAPGGLVRLNSANEVESAESLVMEAMGDLPKNSSILVLSINSNITVGVVNAIERLDLAANSVVVGHNLTPRIEELIRKEGSCLLGSVSFQHERYGDAIVDLALKVLARATVCRENYIDPKWVGR